MTSSAAIDRNPPCANTAAGGQLETYLADDVPHWIRANLPVLPDARSWTIAGFSHGGECAAYLAAAHPSLWANMVSVSGPDKPGEHRPVFTKNTYFNGSEAEFEATWPANVMAKGTYPDTTAIFVAGALDAHFRPAGRGRATAAEKAGWHVTYWAVPGQSHSGPTLTKGLEAGYDKLISIAQSGPNAVDPSRGLCDSSATVHDCASAQVAAVAATVVVTDLGLLLVFFVVQFALFFRLRQTAPSATWPAAASRAPTNAPRSAGSRPLVCAADSCTRMRASPAGRPGTRTPSRTRRASASRPRCGR